MDLNCYNAVIAEMKTLLDGQKFIADGDIFKNEAKAVQVSYDEGTKMFMLKTADVIDGNVGEFEVISSWLFDDDQTEKDAAAVGVDFADTLRSKLGIKKTRTNSAGDVALPTASKGDAVTLTTLTQKLLATFPECKDDYKAFVAKYGKFLHQNFYITRFVPLIKEMLSDDKKNKKAIKKLFDMLWEMYVEGDSDTVDAVVTVISASIYGNENYIALFKQYTEGKDHLVKSVEELLSVAAKSKKLREAMQIQ